MADRFEEMVRAEKLPQPPLAMKASELACITLGGEEGTTYLGPKFFKVKAAIYAALRAESKRAQEAMRERAARECYFPINHQHPLKPAGVVMSTSPASPGHADIIRFLPIEE